MGWRSDRKGLSPTQLQPRSVDQRALATHASRRKRAANAANSAEAKIWRVQTHNGHIRVFTRELPGVPTQLYIAEPSDTKMAVGYTAWTCLKLSSEWIAFVWLLRKT